MAFAYLDPATVLTDDPSPRRPRRPRAGSRVPRPPEPTVLHDQAPRAGRQVDLLAIAEGFAVSAGGITGLRGLDERAWILLAATDLFEAWAIGWPPRGRGDRGGGGGRPPWRCHQDRPLPTTGGPPPVRVPLRSRRQQRR